MKHWKSNTIRQILLALCLLGGLHCHSWGLYDKLHECIFDRSTVDSECVLK